MLRSTRASTRAPGERPRRAFARGRRRCAARASRRRSRRASPPRPVAVLAHMSPDLRRARRAARAAARRPVLLWFTHWRARGLLRLAERVSTTPCSGRPRARSRSDRASSSRSGTASTWQSFPCVAPAAAPLRLLALGRTSPAKGLETVIARRRARSPESTLELRGPSLTDEERAPSRSSRRSSRLGSTSASLDAGAASRSASVSRGRDVLVNNMRAGALDKVVYEAAALVLAGARRESGVRRRSSRRARCASRRTTPRALAERLRALLDAGPSRARDRRRAARRVARDHSVEQWADAGRRGGAR